MAEKYIIPKRCLKGMDGSKFEEAAKQTEIPFGCMMGEGERDLSRYHNRVQSTYIAKLSQRLLIVIIPRTIGNL